jgi:Ca-activated chloride channel family protein
MRWAWPHAFLLLLLIPPLAAWVLLRARRAAMRFSSIEGLSAIGPTWRHVIRPAPALLRLVALALMVVALARPQHVLSETRTSTEGIAMMIVLDRSSSMAEPTTLDGRRVSRFDAVRSVMRQFVLGDDELPGRPNDLIGLVTFARYADTVCPLVRAHDALIGLADETDTVQVRAEDGTAIGDGLALAAARLHAAEQELVARQARASAEAAEGEELTPEEAPPDFTIKSKVIILLTDGEQNAGERRPLEAARLAREWGITVYTIGLAAEPQYREFAGMRIPIGGGVDEALLEAIARETGGVYWRAKDAASLRTVYEEIDRLETTEIESIEYAEYEEAFEPWAVAAGLVLAGEMLIRFFVLRRAPA